ncbi:MAG: DUF1631 family protein [Pseudomonadota bacterium]
MPSTAPSASAQHQALYRATVQEAAAGGHMLMGKLVDAARLALQTREAACRDLRERDALVQSAKQLRSWEAKLCEHYPHALLDAFNNPEGAKKAGTLASADVGFDELELMDEVQVLTSVTLARTQQVAMLAAEASLAELNTLICSTLGLGYVHADRNPLRPQIYVNALKAVVEQTGLPSAMQLDWLGAMSTSLGQELRVMYEALCDRLRGQGVVAAGYVVLQTPSASGMGGGGVGRGIAQDLHHEPAANAMGPIPAGQGMASAPPYAATAPSAARAGGPAQRTNETLLTLDKLRRLLAGELDAQAHLSPMEQFAQRFSREFEVNQAAAAAPAAEFDATVPAALEALKEMKQVDEVVQRLQKRRGPARTPKEAGDTSVEAVRAHLRSHAQGVAQSLSLEVITLMVDNIARDGRLLAPVQQLIRRLEPALLRLALVDPRLFTNKQHPARVLVQEVADHSLAYASPLAQGFAEFALSVGQAFDMLAQAPIDNAEPFEQVLAVLRDEWRQASRAGERNRAAAVQALEHAELRNVLAEKIATDIAAHPDAARVPGVIVDFLCGPWAQVLAQARIAGTAVAAGTADKYQSLVAALLWSTHPDISRKDAPKLTRLVPPLLGTLREGLETIRYPSTKTSAFFEALMGLHQRAFQAEHKPQAPATPMPMPAPAAAASRPSLVDDGDPWLVPEEADASNFIDLPDTPVDDAAVAQPPHAADPVAGDTVTAAMPMDAQQGGNTWALGCWVELLVHGQWVRTQLTWTSSHRTLFLFTSAAGTTQSMTRRSRDKLIAAGHLRVISGAAVVDGALNVVAQMAMRNSVNTLA